MAGTVAAVTAYNLFTHVQTRVIAWSDPWGHIDTAGYQVAHSLFAIGTGGWFGMGLGEGMPGAVPVAESDFIFSAICEELGTFFGICLILVEISCFIMFINISLKMQRRFYKLAALGLSIEYIPDNRRCYKIYTINRCYASACKLWGQFSNKYSNTFQHNTGDVCVKW